MFAPGYQSGDGTQASIPVLARPKLNQVQIDEQTAAGRIWDTKSQQRLVAIRKSDPTYLSDPDKALAERKAQVEKLLSKAHHDDDDQGTAAAAARASGTALDDDAEMQEAIAIADALNK